MHLFPCLFQLTTRKHIFIGKYDGKVTRQMVTLSYQIRGKQTYWKQIQPKILFNILLNKYFWSSYLSYGKVGKPVTSHCWVETSFVFTMLFYYVSMTSLCLYDDGETNQTGSFCHRFCGPLQLEYIIYRYYILSRVFNVGIDFRCYTGLQVPILISESGNFDKKLNFVEKSNLKSNL